MIKYAHILELRRWRSCVIGVDMFSGFAGSCFREVGILRGGSGTGNTWLMFRSFVSCFVGTCPASPSVQVSGRLKWASPLTGVSRFILGGEKRRVQASYTQASCRLHTHRPDWFFEGRHYGPDERTVKITMSRVQNAPFTCAWALKGHYLCVMHSSSTAGFCWCKFLSLVLDVHIHLCTLLSVEIDCEVEEPIKNYYQFSCVTKGLEIVIHWYKV